MVHPTRQEIRAMTPVEKSILRHLGARMLRKYQSEIQARYAYWYHRVGDLPAETVRSMWAHSYRFYVTTTMRDCENWRWKIAHTKGEHRQQQIGYHRDRIETSRQCRHDLQALGQTLKEAE